MHATTLLVDLRARGLRLRVDGETLLVSPRRLLTDADRAALRMNKPALRLLLQAEADAPLRLDRYPGVAAALDVFAGATVVRCPRCGGDRWRSNLARDGEYCVTCTTASPMTRPPREPREEG
jgi:hypothetical protein